MDENDFDEEVGRRWERMREINDRARVLSGQERRNYIRTFGVPDVSWEAALDLMDWNAHELSDALAAYDCAVYKAPTSTDYLITGNGVRLRLPYLWVVDMDPEALNVAILNGIKASREHRKVLGY